MFKNFKHLHNCAVENSDALFDTNMSKNELIFQLEILGIKGLIVRDSPEALCCALEQDRTEKLLTGM